MGHARLLSPGEIDALLSGATVYRSAVSVTATPAEQSMTWTTPRGDILSADAGDWIVSDGVDWWTVDAGVFADTYTRVTGDRYRKTALITAVRIVDAFAVSTLEGLATGAGGDWLARNPGGECWPITNEQFRRRYVAT